MATMATGHSLSVVTNSCLKNPRHPISGNSYTVDERPALPCDARLYAQYAEELAEAMRHCSPEQVSAGINEIQDYSEELANLSDDEFYRKLIQLKHEQKKALSVCERLYAAKLQAEETYRNKNIQSIDGVKYSETANGNGFMDDAIEDPSLVQSGDNLFNPINTAYPMPDRIMDMSIKPPSGRPSNSKVIPYTTPIRSKSPDLLVRPSSAPVTGRRRSFDTNLFADKSQNFVQHADEIMSSSYDKHSEALARVDDMWERFSVDDYAPPKRPSSASSYRSSRSDGSGWRHRITIPKPFKMTLRESLTEKKRSKACLELEKQREEKLKAEEEELQKKFKASPLPAHIYLPLYDELNEKSEAKRHYAQQYSKEILESKVKPFKFSQREENKKHHRCHSAPVCLRKEQFKAKDVPATVYDRTVADKLMQEEEYRKIRIKLRSDYLLRKSSLPAGMEARQRKQAQKMEEKAQKERKKRQKPKIARDVPDYDALYRQFQNELSRRKYGRETTVTKPFNLQTNQLSSSREKILQDMERDEEILRENRWPYQSARVTPRRALGSLSASLDAIPYKSTNSQDVRSSVNKQKLYSLTRKEKEEIEQDRLRRTKEMKLRKSILKKTADIPNPRETVAERLKGMKRSDRTRADEYDLELEEIRRRVADRPLLVERQSEKNARRIAEKRFRNKIESVGLDEDFIQSRSSRAGSYQTGSEGFDNYEEHDIQPSTMTMMNDVNTQDRTYVRDSEDASVEAGTEYAE